MTPIAKIKHYFRDSRNSADVLELNLGQLSFKVSKLGDSYLFSDETDTLTVKEPNLPDFIRFAVESIPNEISIAEVDEYFKAISIVLEEKKQHGLIIEIEPNKFQTTSGAIFEIKPAFGTVWISKVSEPASTFYNREETQFNVLLQELFSSGFLSDSKLSIHHKHISDNADRASNFPCKLSQALVLDLIKDNVFLKGLEGNWFSWGVEGSPLVPDSGNPTIYLLLNGKKVAKPFIEDNRLKFEILDNKEILDQVLPDFDTSTIKPTKLKLSDVMKVADSVSSKNLRLYHPPYVFDVFQKDGKKAILVNGLKSAISDSLDITNPLTLDNEVVSAVEVPFLAERLNVEELLNLLYRTIIFEFQSLVFYGSNIGVVSGVLANEVNSIVSGAFHQTTSSIQDLHNRVLMLGGIPSKYSNPATWSAFTGVAQVVSEIPFDIQSVISHALSLEMVTIASYNQLHDFTKDADPVTNKIVTMFLEQHQVTVQSLQKILTDSKLT